MVVYDIIGEASWSMPIDKSNFNLEYFQDVKKENLIDISPIHIVYARKKGVQNLYTLEDENGPVCFVLTTSRSTGFEEIELAYTEPEHANNRYTETLIYYIYKTGTPLLFGKTRTILGQKLIDKLSKHVNLKVVNTNTLQEYEYENRPKEYENDPKYQVMLEHFCVESKKYGKISTVMENRDGIKYPMIPKFD